MRKIVYVMIMCLLLVGCTPTVETEYEEKIYNIEYQYFDETNQTISAIPKYMWNPKGVYPNSYKWTRKETIDALRNYRKDADTIYAFEGWYYDVGYQNKLIGGEVFSTVEGDIVLYAKIVEREKYFDDVVTASITYVWNDFGVRKEGISSFPDEMIQGLEFPQEYEEGETICLPQLKKWEQSEKIVYEFGGWYYDEKFEKRLENDTIPNAQIGNIILYAAIEVWIG